MHEQKKNYIIQATDLTYLNSLPIKKQKIYSLLDQAINTCKDLLTSYKQTIKSDVRDCIKTLTDKELKEYQLRKVNYFHTSL